jgi:hypothetical protein
MTDEERQRAMDFIAEQSAKNPVDIEKLLNRDPVASLQSSEKANEIRRKLDRDMDRLERVLKRLLKPNARERQRKQAEDKRWREFKKQSSKRFAEISAFAAVSDQKLDALIDIVRADRNGRSS